MIFVPLYLCLIVCCPTTQVFKTTPTPRMSSQTMMQTLEASYQEISNMTANTYNKEKIVDAIKLVLELADTEDKIVATEYLFKILTTHVGRLFMTYYKNFAETSARKAEEFLAKFRHATEPYEVSLRNTIHIFILDSLEVFQLHNIHLGDYTQEEKEEEDEYEYLEDEPEEEAEEFFDEAAYEEYEYPEEDEEYMDEDEQEIERRLTIARQKHQGFLKQVHDEMRRRDDPFFQDGMRVLKQQQKKYWEDCKEEEKRQSLVFRNVIRRAMENEAVIEPGVSFKCDYEIVELLTGSKITDKMTQILGAYVKIDYDEDLMNAGVYIFDGVFNHEFAVLADMKSMISEIYKEIRKDTAQCLYDFGFCRDVSGLIAGYVC